MNITHKGDSLDYIKTLKDNSVDLICTDPPYDISVGNSTGSKLTGFNSFASDSLQLMTNGYDEELYFAEYKRLMKKFHAFIFCSNKQLPYLLNFAVENDYTFNVLVWWKYNAAPMTNNKWKNDIEYCVHIKEKGISFKGDNKVDKIAIQRSITGHPTEKPLELVKKYISIGSNKNDVVLDPFMGSGTTGIACTQLDRKFIGVEIEKEWYDKAVNRISRTSSSSLEEW